MSASNPPMIARDWAPLPGRILELDIVPRSFPSSTFERPGEGPVISFTPASCSRPGSAVYPIASLASLTSASFEACRPETRHK